MKAYAGLISGLLRGLLVADIWGCGVILYQLLSLLVDVPFDPVELLLSSGCVPPLSLHARTSPLSTEMHDIVMKALQVDPNLRFQSAEEMGDALHKEEARLLDGLKQVQAMKTKAQAEPAAKQLSTSGSPQTVKAAAAARSSSPLPSAASSTAAPPVSDRKESSSESRVRTASSSSEPVHPRFQRGRKGMAFSSGEDPPRSLVSKL
jgi:serine/threonine protein kinase